MTDLYPTLNNFTSETIQIEGLILKKKTKIALLSVLAWAHEKKFLFNISHIDVVLELPWSEEALTAALHLHLL